MGESEVADGEDEPVAWEDIGELLIYQIAKQGYIQEYFPLPEFAKTHFLTEQDGGYVSHKESPRWYGVFHNMSEDLDDEDHFMQFRTMSSYVKDDYLCFLATCFIDSPEHGSISIVIYEAKQSYEDDTIDLMKLIYRGFTEGMENRAKINALFGAERFIEGGQNALLMNNDGGYYVTTSHISDKGIVCMGTNHGEVLTIRTVLSDVEVKPPILKKYFRNPISCICSKAISNTEDMIFIADTTGDCLLFTSSRLESQIPSSKTKRIGLKIGCKVTNAFFCDGFLIVIGLKKVGKYDFNGKIQQNVKYLNNNLTNQASCFFNFKYLALETNIIIINESNHELRLYDVLSGQTIKIELEVPQTYTLKTMVIMKNRLRVFFAEGSQGKIRDYELFKHFRDTIS